MKITYLQIVLAVSVSLLAIFWMRALLALLICTILICSWLLGLLMSFQLNPVPATINGSASVRDNKHSLLHTTMVRFLAAICLISVGL